MPFDLRAAALVRQTDPCFGAETNKICLKEFVKTKSASMLAARQLALSSFTEAGVGARGQSSIEILKLLVEFLVHTTAGGF